MILTVQFGLDGLINLQNVHPIFVHFPIGLLLASFAFYLIGLILCWEELFHAGKWTLLFGTAGALVAVLTGLQAMAGVPHFEDTHEIMMVHRNIGFGVLTISMLLSLWVLVAKQALPSKFRWAFLLLFFIATSAIGQGADLGGRMVFFHGVGVGRKEAIEEKAPAAETKAPAHEHAGEHHH